MKQNWTRQKTLATVFAKFLTVTTKNSFLGDRIGTRLCLQPILKISKYFPSFEPFGKLFDYLYTIRSMLQQI